MPNNLSVNVIEIAKLTSNTTTVTWDVKIPTYLIGDDFWVHLIDSVGDGGVSNSFTVAPGHCSSECNHNHKYDCHTVANKPANFCLARYNLNIYGRNNVRP